MKAHTEILRECQSCQVACLQTVAHCLEVGGSHANPELLQRLADTAEFCAVSASFLARGSDAFEGICAVCADLCERCAQDCEGFGDEQMKSCAAACRACSDACRQHVALAA
jgi:hypothetical protein